VNFIDPILAITIITFTFIGYKNGFIHSFFNLVKWMGSFLTALFFYSSASVLLHQNFAVQLEWQLPVSFFIVFIFSFLLISLTFLFLNKCIDTSLQKNILNHIAGIIPGFMNGVIAAVIISKLLAASFWGQATDQIKNSLFAASLHQSSNWFDTKLNNIFNASFDQQISGASEAGPGINQSDEFKCTHFISRPDLEEQLLELVNTERIKNVLKTLAADNEMKKAANEHAADMFTRGYFSHNTPKGADPFDRMKNAGIYFMFAGENLAHYPIYFQHIKV
jgi:uncharacterized membrane protein required for colicin V production